MRVRRRVAKEEGPLPLPPYRVLPAIAAGARLPTTSCTDSVRLLPPPYLTSFSDGDTDYDMVLFGYVDGYEYIDTYDYSETQSNYPYVLLNSGTHVFWQPSRCLSPSSLLRWDGRSVFCCPWVGNASRPEAVEGTLGSWSPSPVSFSCR